MEEKWVGDLTIPVAEAVRPCPKCHKQSYVVNLNRHGVPVSAECVLCGYIEDKKVNKCSEV